VANPRGYRNSEVVQAYPELEQKSCLQSAAVVIVQGLQSGYYVSDATETSQRSPEIPNVDWGQI